MEKYFDINKNGSNIRCKQYFLKGEVIKTCVIYGHGFAGHKETKAAERFAELVQKKHRDAAVITFDWPCHGKDVKKKLTLGDCLAYLETVIADCAERFPESNLYGYATSFGGYLFLKYIHDHGSPFRKTALRCPAVNMYEILTEAIMKNDETDKLRKGKDVPIGFDRKVMVNQNFLEELRNSDIREYVFLEQAEDILILHGTKDEVVPFEGSKAFAENNLIEFIPIQRANHQFQDPASMDEAIHHIQTFFFGG